MTGVSVKASVTSGNAKGSVLVSDEAEGGMPRGPSSLSSARASSGLCAFGFRLLLLHRHTCSMEHGQTNALDHGKGSFDEVGFAPGTSTDRSHKGKIAFAGMHVQYMGLKRSSSVKATLAEDAHQLLFELGL